MTLSGMLQRTRALTRAGLGDLLVAQLVSVASSLLVTMSTAFFMGPTGRGEVAFVLTLGNLVGAVAFGSLHVGTIKADEAGFSNGRQAARRLASASALVVLLLTAAAYLLLSGNSESLASSVLMAGAGAALVTLNLAVLRIGQALGRDRSYRNSWLVQGVGFATLGTLSAWLTGNPELVIASWLVTTGASTLVMARSINWSDRPGAPVSPRTVLADSWQAHLGIMGTQLLARMHIVALGLVSTKEQVGLLSVAAPIAELTWLVSEAFSLIAFRMAARKDASHEQRRLLIAHVAISVVGAAIVCGFAVIALPLILPEFEGAVLLIFLLVPGVLLQGVSRVAMSRIIGRTHRRTTLLVGAGSGLLSLIYLPVAAVGGAVGVAAAASILYSLQAAVIIYLDRHLEAGHLR